MNRTSPQLPSIARALLVGTLLATHNPIGLVAQDTSPQDNPKSAMHAVLLPCAEVTPERLRREQRRGMNVVVLQLNDNSQESRQRIAQSALQIEAANLRLAYWIEVARNPELANAHPEWMASLQGHNQWRRLFPDVPEAGPDQITKVYPWVPILYREAYQAHLQRIRELLADRPAAAALFLNDLQGAPSACGCGNELCRWTTDYGPKRTATLNGDDTAARFLRDVAAVVPDLDLIPVWVTECEEHDGAADGKCAGVGCFRGICWKAYTRQLMPVVEEASRIGVLLPTLDFKRTDPVYGSAAGWVTAALQTFQSMPPKHEGKAVKPQQLVAVVQGWGTEEEFVAAQLQAAIDADVRDFVVAYDPIRQAWEPRVLDFPGNKTTP